MTCVYSILHLCCWIVMLLFFTLCSIIDVSAIFVDKGDPYKLGPLKVGQLTLSKTTQGAPMHTEVLFPLEAGDYPPIFFVGGLDGAVLAEFYLDVEAQIASHGFVLFGVDPDFPFLRHGNVGSDPHHDASATDVKAFFDHMDWLKNYMENRTEARIAWDHLALACHSAGCDATLNMIRYNSTVVKASVFLEPFSSDAKQPVTAKLPVLSYGTELSEEGVTKCAIKGMDWRQFYSIFSCPKILIEVKGFGHCDILDPVPWEACHVSHFCKTTNSTRNAAYHRFAQGMVAGFLIGTMEDNPASLNYILNTTLLPLTILDLRHDLNCSI